MQWSNIIVGIVIILFIVSVGTYDLPKIVWTHWNTADLPEFCRLNLERTRRILHDWDVRFFTDADFLTWCDPPAGYDALSAQHKADFMRLWLLKKHGGVWMDISIVLNTSLNPMYDECRENKAELSGFYIEGTTTDMRYPVFENWFIMAPRNSNIIDLWYSEFSKATRIGFQQYKAEEQKSGLIFHDLLKEDGDIYLTQHLCFQKVIQHRVWRPPIILYKKAEDTMFKIQKDCDWKIDCMQTEFRKPTIRELPFIKLRGCDRGAFPLSYFE